MFPRIHCLNQLGFKRISVPFFLCHLLVFSQQMRHQLTCLLLVFVFLFSKTLLSSRRTVNPKGGEPGIWLPLALNKQLLSDSHGCTMVLREEHPLGNHLGDKKLCERMDRDGRGAYVGSRGGRDLGKVYSTEKGCETHKLEEKTLVLPQKLQKLELSTKIAHAHSTLWKILTRWLLPC